MKPSNVLLDSSEDERDHCYLADFGLTQSASERGPTDGQFMGTVAYVSPEQIRGDQVDGRADQYGLACLLFESLTASVPYGGRSDVAAIFAHLEDPPPRASERRATLPEALDPVLARGMAKDPDERFDSCAALVSAAAEVLAPAPRERGARMRLVAGLAAAAVVLVSAVAVALLAGDEGDGRAPRQRRAGADRSGHERGGRAHADPRAPGRGRGHARRALDGGLPRRCAVAL